MFGFQRSNFLQGFPINTLYDFVHSTRVTRVEYRNWCNYSSNISNYVTLRPKTPTPTDGSLISTSLTLHSEHKRYHTTNTIKYRPKSSIRHVLRCGKDIRGMRSTHVLLVLETWTWRSLWLYETFGRCWGYVRSTCRPQGPLRYIYCRKHGMLRLSIIKPLGPS
jgi:hypothetical protein